MNTLLAGDDRVDDSIDKLVGQLSINPYRPTVLLFCNWDYYEILMNWLAMASRQDLQTEDIHIAACDARTHATLCEKGFNSVLFELNDKPWVNAAGPLPLNVPWLQPATPIQLLRTQVMEAAACHFKCVLVNDVDAVWVGDVYGYLTSEIVRREYSLIFAQDLTWPPRTPNGLNVCSGFYYMRGGAHVYPMMELARKIAEAQICVGIETEAPLAGGRLCGDDQSGLNFALREFMSWQEPASVKKFWVNSDECIPYSEHPIFGANSFGASAAILPLEQWVRVGFESSPQFEPAPRQQCYLVHPIADKGDKKRALQYWNLWGLRPDFLTASWNAYDLTQLDERTFV